MAPPGRAGAFCQLLVLLALLPPYLLVAVSALGAAALTFGIAGAVSYPCGSWTHIKFLLVVVWELCCLNLIMPTMVLRYVLDALCSPAAPAAVPSSAFMSARIGGPPVTAVRDSAPLTQGGAGGHGTERSWLSLSREGGSEATHVFMKSRTQQFFESFFLNLFGVYQNEVVARAAAAETPARRVLSLCARHQTFVSPSVSPSVLHP